MSILSCSGIGTALSEHTNLVTTHYYHSSICQWIQKAKAKTKLTQAVKDYIVASLEFDPYGMRHTLAEDPIKKFGLRIPQYRPQRPSSIH
jgi:hypothetical protein